MVDATPSRAASKDTGVAVLVPNIQSGFEVNMVSMHRTCAATFRPFGHWRSPLATRLCGRPSFAPSRTQCSAHKRFMSAREVRNLYEVAGVCTRRFERKGQHIGCFGVGVAGAEC